jgi:hypothetical protein
MRVLGGGEPSGRRSGAVKEPSVNGILTRRGTENTERAQRKMKKQN